MFALIVLVMYQSFTSLSRLITRSAIRTQATMVLNEELETLRNVPYELIGVSGGIPSGIFPQQKNITRNGRSYTINWIVRSIDDAFDGTIGGTPNDLSPADYKLVEITVTCTSCTPSVTVVIPTTVAPPGLETASGNGALFVRVFDADGQAVGTASVHIENPSLNPAVSFNEVTGADGWLRLVDVPPALESYAITVTKPGYSTDQTYPPNAPANPSPLKPHVTVIAGATTQVSFAIDETSEVIIASITEQCLPQSAASFAVTGTKLIGTEPDVLKYNRTDTTDTNGIRVLQSMEWDTYTTMLTGNTYFLLGSLPQQPVAVPPGAIQTISLVTAQQRPRALLVDVIDANTLLPIAHATARLSGAGYDRTRDTGEGAWLQTDWTGGSGQDMAGETTRFFASDHIAWNAVGELALEQSGGQYYQAGWLVSSSFDNSTSTNYYHLTVNPQDQPAGAGPDPVRIQVASNDNNTTWNFVGPDGTPGTYYTTHDRTLNPLHANDRYIRYRIELLTADVNVTPNISDIAISFAATCVPSGQAYFDSAPAGSMTLDVSKDGYTPVSQNVSLSSSWQQITVQLSPSTP